MTNCPCRAGLSLALAGVLGLALAASPHRPALAGESSPDDALVVVEGWENLVRIVNDSPQGTSCHSEPKAESDLLATLYFKQPLTRIDARHGWVRVQTGETLCWVPEKWIKQMHSSPVYCLRSPPEQTLTPIQKLLGEVALPVASEGVAAGRFYPTFYQVALEAYHPLKEGEQPVALRDKSGAVIATVSPAFRKALLMQGTAALRNGIVLNVAGQHQGEQRFVALPRGHLGLGIHGFELTPYRSVALDFDWLCDVVRVPGCAVGNLEVRDQAKTKANRKKLVGMLLFIPALKGALVRGTVHDGYVCAVDVGGGIKNDRIDLYVGTDPAGNPYYPPCRRDNPFILNGVQSLIPSDWHHWAKDLSGEYKRIRPTEYRENAQAKGLEVIAFPGVKCRKSP